VQYHLDPFAALSDDDLRAHYGWDERAISVARSGYLRRAGVPLKTRCAIEGASHFELVWGPRRPVGLECGAETSIDQAIRRMARYWAWVAHVRGDLPSQWSELDPTLRGILRTVWSECAGEDWGDSRHPIEALYGALVHSLRARMWSPNSPQWYNAGLFLAYGTVRDEGAGSDYGHALAPSALWGADGKPAHPGLRPLHACFIQSVQDDLTGEGGIPDLGAREARVFKYGSGSGTLFSALRGRNEGLSGGGTSSGMMSFIRALDAQAGAIKSGGTTRRAAKMVVCDVNHPDILDLVRCKVRAEAQALALALGSQILAEQDRLPYGDPPYTLGWSGAQSAYAAVPHQNANYSVRASGADLWVAVDAGEAIELRGRTAWQEEGSIPAAELVREIAAAAWACGDPGVQWDDLIQAEHTCPEDGRINASNPCSEYLFLDDTACNLGSVRLTACPEGLGQGDWVAAISGLVAWVLDITIDAAAYPTRRVAEQTARTRTIGAGPMDLGAYLVRCGCAYDSDEGRALAVSQMWLILLGSVRTSQALARIHGPAPCFAGSEQNRAAMRTWLGARGLPDAPVRNAQFTVVAPTGTIGLVAGCDSTGCEPLWSYEGHRKTLADGTVQITGIPACVEYARAKGLDRPGVVVSARELSPEAHVWMCAALQPYVSGGISKTVNLPHEATVEDILKIYRLSWELGVKCIAVYRDGSKASQPLDGADPDEHVRKILAAVQRPAAEPRVTRAKRKGRLPAVRYAASIAGRDFYLTVAGEDGRPVQIRAEMGPSEDGTARTLLDLASRLSSLLVQVGVPLEEVGQMWSESADAQTAGPVVPPIEAITFAAGLPALVGRILLSLATPSRRRTKADVVEVPKAKQRVKITGFCRACGGEVAQTGTCRTCLGCGASSGGCS
jgi:ribonucleoside-diphosphate reductase alpha chain